MDASRLFLTMIWPWKKQEAIAAPAPAAARQSDVAEDLVAAFPDPVLVLDRKGGVIAANEPVRGIFDFDPRGQHLSASIRAPAVLEALAAVCAGGEARHVDYELRLPLARQFDVYLAPVAGRHDGAAAALMVLKDLTREQQIERMRADFVANASHELRTPLASLSGFIETLLGAARNDETAREKFLNLMQAQAGRMKRLIDDLLSLSRIEMNAHLRPSATVDLASVAAHAADIMSGLAQQSGCELRLAFEGPLPVTGDWDELVQVVQNLVENALKYGASGKLVEIEGAMVGDSAELRVRDHGPGIAAQHIPRLTERFYRVSVQESRARGGTGLGLAIVKHILNRHRGRLVISSVLGEGSVFTIRIPK